MYYEILPGPKVSPISPEDINPDAMLRAALAPEEADEDAMNTNDQIFDDNQSQKLTTEQIEHLKSLHQSGETSAESIVKNIVAGNENFGKKNMYSKEKYLKRKQQKFLKWICPRIPTTRLLADHFSRKDPGRMLDLRIDSLSQILGHANLFQGGKFMLWDDSQGFVAGAILSRLGECDRGSMVVSVHNSPTLQIPFLPYFNCTETNKALMYPMGLKDIGPEPLEATPNHYNPSSVDNPEHMAKHQARYLERQSRRERARACFDNSSFTSIILICNDSDPTSLIDRFARYLSPSGKLVVFCKYKEPILPAFIQARFSEQPAFIDVSLTESWLRPYQTAAGRLHPEMSLPNSSAGFILTATKVTML